MTRNSAIHHAAHAALGARFAQEFYELPEAQRDVLCADVLDLHAAEQRATLHDAVNVLHGRLRPATLASYAGTLCAGQARRR